MSSLHITPLRIPGVRHVIGIASGKGGVGKTFIASNLALALAKMGHRTGLLDADICCPNVFKMLGITHKHSPTADGKIPPVEKWGVRIASMSGLAEREQDPIAWRGPIISKILQQLVKETLWRDLDFLIIDFPSGTSDIPLTLMQNVHIDNLLIVTTPQAVSILDAQRMIGMALLLQVPVGGVIENMRGEAFGEGGGAQLAQQYGYTCISSFPLRKQISTLCDQGQPPVFHMEEAAMQIGKIARHVVEKATSSRT